MECQNCHTVNAEQNKFCHECGAGLPWRCTGCTSEIQPTDKFCGECGLAQSRKKAGKKPTQIGGERKHVSVLFSDLSGYTAMADRLDPEEVREVSSRIFSEIARIVASYQGFIEKFIGDAVLAIFGLPAVHEDDPVRAVKAAMGIHRLVQSISPEYEDRIGQPLHMHSGIHTGLVVTGEMIVEKGIHGVVGDTLNLASRLADVAGPGEILVSTRTHNLVFPYFETRPVGQVTLKGITQPVKPHRIVDASAVNTRFEAARRQGFTDFTGRHRELARLHSCLEKTIAGNGQFVTVTGEAGAGKSRLAYEFRHGIDRNKITVLQGRCQSYGSNIPYFPFLNALKRGLLLKEKDSIARLEKKILSNILAIDTSLERYLPLYFHLLSIPSKKYPLPEDLRGQKLKHSIKQALTDINLLNARRKPMVLILEDWHWVDEASDSILKHLASLMGSYPLMLVILYRHEGRTSWPDWDFHTPCLLKAMDAPDTAHIIQSIWNVNTLPDGFSSIVHARTGGNPLFIEEVCKTLSENGSVRIEGRKAVLLHPVEQLRLPATVQAVIRARLDRLDSHVKESLQRAAVIGREFSLRLLERICNARHRLPLSLNMLEAQELIQQSHRIPETEYMFKHVLTQVAVYESLLLKKRKALHASVGQALEELYADRLEEQCENLAHHYSNSTHRKKALFYLEMAATKATRVHSLSEARRYYEGAFSIFEANRLDAESRQTFIDLTLKWAEVSQYAPSNKIMGALKRALHYARAFDNRSRVARVSYWIGKYGYMQGDFIEALPEVERCIKWAGDLDDRELLAISYNLRGRACLYTCEYSKGIDYLNNGLELIRPFEKWDDIAYSTAILGLLSGLTGDHKKSMSAIAKAIRIARRHEIPTFEAMAFGYLGSIHFWYGNWNASINNCMQCIAISKKLDNALPIIWGTFFKGAALFNSGRRPEGLAVIEQSIEMRANVDSVLALRFFYALFAENLAIHGNYRRAESINNKAMALSRSGQKWGDIASYRTMAVLAAAENQPDWHHVAACMGKSIDLATSAEAIPELVVSLTRYSDLMHRKGDIDSAKAYQRQAKQIATGIGSKGHQSREAVPVWQTP